MRCLAADGEGDGEDGTLAWGAADGDGAAEGIDEFFDDGESQAGAGMGAGDGAVDLSELFEDCFAVFFGDAGAGVGDANLDVIFLDEVGVDIDVSLFRGELDSVTQ